MKGLGKKLIHNYSSYVSKHPYTIILTVIILIIFASYFSQSIETENMEYQNMLPEGIEEIDAFRLLEDNFGGTQSAMIAIEINPSTIKSNEPRDIREPEILSYVNILSQMSETLEDTLEVNSASTILKGFNSDKLPKSKTKIIDIIENNEITRQYISPDNQMALVKIKLSEDANEADIAKELQKIIDETDKPTGIIVNIAGDSMANPVVLESISPDMAKTSNFSLIAIMLILILMMQSLWFAATPLLTIGVGIIFAMGFVGLIGMNLSTATSGVISMIMGIGIDFGIQTVSRFRQELKIKEPEQAIESTLNNVFMPMTTTTLAALIGFRAMSMGQLTMMADMGTIMSYGVAACYVAATILPAILIAGKHFHEKIF